VIDRVDDNCLEKNYEPKLRIELRTSSLQDWCSTSKLFGLGLDLWLRANLLQYIVLQNYVESPNRFTIYLAIKVVSVSSSRVCMQISRRDDWAETSLQRNPWNPTAFDRRSEAYHQRWRNPQQRRLTRDKLRQLSAEYTRLSARPL
jgi:hypothetical protein